MFESDDLDQILSQFDFPDAAPSKNTNNCTKDNEKPLEDHKNYYSIKISPKRVPENEDIIVPRDVNTGKVALNSDIRNLQSPSTKHTKRKVIDTYFDHKVKRKFPGPAGLLTGNFKENKDEFVCQMELLSQDVDFTQNCLHKDAFDTPLWKRLLKDIKEWNVGSVDMIKSIKQCSLAGSLRRRKAQIVAAFIESVDRSMTNPLITLRDATGVIKCTLHRDAWSKFSSYIAAEYCAIVLWRPTILTTGSAFKNHYLNITLSNIFAIYSSAALEENKEDLPDGYVKISDDNLTIITTDLQTLKRGLQSVVEQPPETNDLLDLDNIFSEELF